ncbi:MAG: hypothetical protein WCT01_00900 [Candidatus Shapirobacteria bacterium]
MSFGDIESKIRGSDGPTLWGKGVQLSPKCFGFGAAVDDGSLPYPVGEGIRLRDPTYSIAKYDKTGAALKWSGTSNELRNQMIDAGIGENDWYRILLMRSTLKSLTMAGYNGVSLIFGMNPDDQFVAQWDKVEDQFLLRVRTGENWYGLSFVVKDAQLTSFKVFNLCDMSITKASEIATKVMGVFNVQMMKMGLL